MKKKKIIITGVCGYMGTQLCRLYKNTKYNITVIDNRFLPERVRQLENNAIKKLKEKHITEI